jgi:hypothetical protein
VFRERMAAFVTQAWEEHKHGANPILEGDT